MANSHPGGFELNCYPLLRSSEHAVRLDLIASHMAVLAGTGLFTVEVLLARPRHLLGPVLHLESRRASLGGLTKHPTAEWMLQMARNATDESSRFSSWSTVSSS